MNVGARIKEARDELGISQAELGERLEMSDSAVTRWERGDRQPTLATLSRIASAVDKPLTWFFEEAQHEVA